MTYHGKVFNMCYLFQRPKKMVQMYSYPAQVRRVIDADSLVLDIDLGFGISLTRQKVRLKGINAPEMKTLEGRLAKKWMEECLKAYGYEVFIISSKPPKKGKWGRWLVDIYAENLHINKALIDSGHAVIYQ